MLNTSDEDHETDFLWSRSPPYADGFGLSLEACGLGLVFFKLISKPNIFIHSFYLMLL